MRAHRVYKARKKKGAAGGGGEEEALLADGGADVATMSAAGSSEKEEDANTPSEDTRKKRTRKLGSEATIRGRGERRQQPKVRKEKKGGELGAQAVAKAGVKAAKPNPASQEEEGRRSRCISHPCLKKKMRSGISQNKPTASPSSTIPEGGRLRSSSNSCSQDVEPGNSAAATARPPGPREKIGKCEKK